MRDLEDMEPKCLGLNDLLLETQNSYLEFFKILLTSGKLKDCEHGKPKQKGFANHKQNRKRDKHIFTIAESQFKALADKRNLHYLHEFKVKVKDHFGTLHNYKLDFYFPLCKTDIEISPDFHNTYLLVKTRDTLRAKLLEKHGIKSYHIFAKTQPKTQIDYPRAIALLEQIQNSSVSRETLISYFGNNYKGSDKT